MGGQYSLSRVFRCHGLPRLPSLLIPCHNSTMNELMAEALQYKEEYKYEYPAVRILRYLNSLGSLQRRLVTDSLGYMAIELLQRGDL